MDYEQYALQAPLARTRHTKKLVRFLIDSIVIQNKYLNHIYFWLAVYQFTI